jgi:hypothetical protein
MKPEVIYPTVEKLADVAVAGGVNIIHYYCAPVDNGPYIELHQYSGGCQGGAEYSNLFSYQTLQYYLPYSGPYTITTDWDISWMAENTGGDAWFLAGVAVCHVAIFLITTVYDVTSNVAVSSAYTVIDKSDIPLPFHADFTYKDPNGYIIDNPSDYQWSFTTFLSGGDIYRIGCSMEIVTSGSAGGGTYSLSQIWAYAQFKGVQITPF